MNEVENFTIALFFASAFGFLLSRARISPVIAYIISGSLLAFLGVKLNGDVFNFLSNFAVQILAFMIGLTFNIETLRKTLSSAALIVVTELLIVGSVVSFVSSLFGFTLVEALLLLVSTFSTSSSIVFKQSVGLLPKEELDIALATSSIEDIVTFLVVSVISGQIVSVANAVYLFASSIGSFGLGLLLARYVLVRIVKVSTPELTMLWTISIVSFFSLLGLYLNIPPVLPPLLFGISVALVLREGIDRIIKQLHTLLDFFLVIFFVIAGQEFTPGVYSVLYVPLAMVAVGLKYFAFSTGYWIASGDFKRAFNTGLHMTPLSEFGIVIALSAISFGHRIGSLYDFIVVLVGTSFTISGLILKKEKKISIILSNIEAKSKIISRLNIILLSFRTRLSVPAVVRDLSNSLLLYLAVVLGIMIPSDLTVYYVRSADQTLGLYIIVALVLGTLVSLFYFSLRLRDSINATLNLQGNLREVANYFVYSVFIFISLIYLSTVIRIVEIPSVLVSLALPLSVLIYLTYTRIYKLLKKRS
mgnify:CR=1 FL=1